MSVLARTVFSGLVVFATAILLAGVGAPPATAAEQTIHLCEDESGSETDWTGDPLNPVNTEHAWRFSGSCASLRMLSSVSPTAGFWSNWWRFPGVFEDGRVQFTKASFGLSGSDGTDGGAGNRSQGVALCSPDECGPLIRPSGPDVLVSEFHDLTVGDGFMPEGTNQFRVIGSCTGVAGPMQPESCVPGRPMQLTDLQLTFEDDEVPSVVPADPVETTSVTPLVVDGWNRIGKLSVAIHAHDSGAGVRRAQYMFNATFGQNGARYYGQTGCGEIEVLASLSKLCPRQTDVTYVFNSDTFGTQAGNNKLEVSVFDGAGNQSDQQVFNFKLDRSLPTPTELSASTTFLNNWQSDPVVNLTWSNGPDAVESSLNSPVNRAQFRVRKFGNPIAQVTKIVNGVNIQELDDLRLPGQGLWRISMTVWDEAGNASYGQEIQVGVDSSVPAAPLVTQPELLGVSKLADGTTVEWTPPPAVPAGICGYAVSVDQSPSSDPGTNIEYPRSATSATLPKWLPHGKNYVHIRAISCSGIPGQIADVPFEVDALAPAIELSLPNANGWYDEEFPLIVSVDREPGVQMSVAVDDGQISWSDDSEVTVPLNDGRHLVTVRSTDAHGNQARRITNVRFDGTAPHAVFELHDPVNPTSVRVFAHDEISGVSAVLLQFRRVGESEWTGFGTPVFAVNGSLDSAKIVQTFPDQVLADGVYDLRAITIDAAGHRSINNQRSDGSPAALSLPLRAAAGISAGFATRASRRRCDGRKCRSIRRQVLRKQIVTSFGRSAELSGILRNADGDPISDVTLKISESVLGGPRRVVGSIATDKRGEFRFTPAPGPSRRVFVRFEGSATLAPAETEAKLLTVGKLLIDRAPRRARGGRPVTFGGRVISPGITIPPDLNVEFQYRARGRWWPLPSRSVIADVDGKFSATFRFARADRPIVFRLRARLASPQSGWPFETAVSATRELVVLP